MAFMRLASPSVTISSNDQQPGVEKLNISMLEFVRSSFIQLNKFSPCISEIPILIYKIYQ
jgi:hypothetical protein